MIFIDTINRIRQLPEREDASFIRRRRARQSEDSLTLSDAASHVQQISLSYEQDTELTPADSLIANILETFLQQLDQPSARVEALSILAPKKNSWKLHLQTPPVSASETNQYTHALKHTRPKQFEVELRGSDGSKETCYISFIAHHLSTTSQTKLNNLPPIQTIQTPYQAEQLDYFPKHWTFEIDQDGELNPLQQMYEEASNQDNSSSIPGLQIWLERHLDALPIIISDQMFGYVYIGNYWIQQESGEHSEQHSHPSEQLDTKA